MAVAESLCAHRCQDALLLSVNSCSGSAFCEFVLMLARYSWAEHVLA